ncbi:MAG TPA: hypothetical protein VFB08_08085 [Burkholderiales bacterium]|nr:hypothetical protein [Burkholderiales bacterium]
MARPFCRVLVFALPALLAGCSVMDMVLQTRELPRSRVPPNSTEYRCDGGKSFFVRTEGSAAWVIFPEREFRLDKAGGGNRYENRVAHLELDGEQASLTDGPDSYSGCKVFREEK